MHTLQFLFEDADIFAVYKPAGIHSVRLPDGGGASIADLLLEHDAALSDAGRSALDAGLIHRLDYDTSGVLLGARRRDVWDRLFQSLMSGEIKKEYVVIVEGKLTEATTSSSYIGSPHRGARKVKIYTSQPPSSARALQGTTTFTPLEYHVGLNSTVVCAHASPARRHQVRAHAAHVGHPLLGDRLYGATGLLPHSEREFFLHASKVWFTHPISGQAIECISDPSEEVAAILR